jgi:hypothetical protein
MAQIKTREGVSDNLIVAVNAGMDGSRRLGRQGRRTRPAAAAHRSKPLPVLRFTKLNKVFSYGIMATRGSRFAHIGMAADGGGGWRWRGDLTQAQCRWRLAPGLLQLNQGYQRGHRSSVILPGWLIWHGRRYTGAAASQTWSLGFQSLRVKIHRRTGIIYRAFCTKS